MAREESGLSDVWVGCVIMTRGPVAPAGWHSTTSTMDSLVYVAAKLWHHKSEDNSYICE